MVKPLSDREKKKIAKKANAQSKASSQKTTSGSSSSSGIYNNSARKSARQAETGRTSTTTKSNSSSRGSGFEPDSVARSGKTRSQLLSELDRKYGQDFSKKDIHDGNRDFLDRIDNLTTKARFNRQVRNNEKEAQYNHNLMALQRRNDLDQLAAAGKQRFANGAFDLTDRTGKTVEELGVRPETRDDVFNQNVYDFMTPQQRSTYEAFIGLGDRQSAKKYLASIEDGLQQQAADKMLQTIQPGNIENVQDFMDVTRLGVRSGIGRFETGVQQLVNPNAVSKNYTEMAFEEARKNMSGATGVVADLANTVGFMLLPAGGSLVLGLAGGAAMASSAGVKALSAALFGAASGGSTYNDMLQANPGADKFDAKVYSIINGALEGSLQYALGGIGKLGVGGITKATGKSISGAVAKKLANVAKASANTPAVKGLIKALVGGGKWAAGASDEALEEWLQAVLDPVVRNYVLGENNEVQLFSEDQLYAAFLGALGSSVMNAPSNLGSVANAQQVLEETVAKQEAKAAERANKNKPAVSTETPEVPEVTPEQIEAHMDDKKVANLVKQINRLEQKIATDTKKYHHNKPNGGATLESNLEKAQTALAKRVAELEKETAASTENAAGIPGPPPAPVGNEGLGLINSALGEEIEGLDNYNRTRQGTPGRDLINAGIRNGAEGEISPQTNLARPSGERQAAPTRGITPGQTRRQNIQNRVAQQTEGIPFSESLGDRVGGGEVTSQESMVQWFRDSLASAYEQLQEGSQMLEPVHSAVYDTMEQFRNYARNVLGWSEEQIELEIASWNVPEYFTTPPEVTKGHAQATNLMRKAREEAKAQGQQGQQLQEQSVEEGPAPWEEQSQEQTNTAPTEDEIARGHARATALMKQAREQAKAQAQKAKAQQTEQVTDEDIEEVIASTKDELKQAKAELAQTKTLLAQAQAKEEAAPTTNKRTSRPTAKQARQAEVDAEIDGLVNAVQNDEMTPGDAAGEMYDLLNQMSREREEAGEIVSEAGEKPQLGEYSEYNALPEVNVTGGRIEIKFPRWPDKKTIKELKDNGFRRDKKTDIWFGGENDYNRRVIEKLTGVKLTPEEFKPQSRRITKEEIANGRAEGTEAQDVLRPTSQRKNGNVHFRTIQEVRGADEEGRAEHRRRREIAREEFDAGVPSVDHQDFSVFFDDEDFQETGVGETASGAFGYGAYVFDENSSLVKYDKDGSAFGGELVRAVDAYHEELRANGMSSNDGDAPALKFYIPDDIDRTNVLSSYCDGFYDEESNTMYIDASKYIDSNISHEFLHSRLTETGMTEKILDAMHDAGLSNDDINNLIDNYVAFEWNYCYGELHGTNKSPFRQYLQELMCDLYAQNEKTASAIEELLPDVDIDVLQGAVIDAVQSKPVHSNPEMVSRYMELAQNPEENEAELSKMVKQAAREAGLTSPLLMHGTSSFGYTKINTKHDHTTRETFFATDNPIIARGYTRYDWNNPPEAVPRRLRDTVDVSEQTQKYTEEKDRLTSELNNYENELDNIMETHYSSFIEWMKNNGFPEIEQSDESSFGWVSLLNDAADPRQVSDNDVETEINGVLRYILDSIYDEKHPVPKEWSDENGVIKDKYSLQYNLWWAQKTIWTQRNAKGDIFNQLDNWVYSARSYVENNILPINRRLEQIKRELRTLEDFKGSGIYQFYANEENLVEIDGDGTYWNEIPGQLLTAYDGAYEWYAERDGLNWDELDYDSRLKLAEELQGAQFVTDDIADFAAHAGMSGVKISNLIDPADDFSEDTPGTIYIFLDPNAQVKSADPVTYDKNGNIIPLDKRFNTSNKDLRRSMHGPRSGVQLQRKGSSKTTATSSTFTENQSGNVPAENVIDELKPIYSAVPQKVRDYIVKHQSDINAEAWKNIVKKGGVDTVAGSLLKTSRWNPLQLEMAVEIGKCFAVNGEHDRAAEVTTKILSQQREFGRAIKYLETLQQYMPHAVTAIGHSIANELDVELSKEEEADLKLCDEILEDGFISQSVIDNASPEFKDWLEKAQNYLDVGTIDATTAAYGAASRIVMAHDEATFRDKFRALQRISLLSNVKTHGRNILGNAAEVAGSVMSRPVGMLADKIIGKSTGERTYGSGGGKAFIQSIAPGVEQAIMDYRLGLSTVGNKFDEGSSRNGVKGLAQQKAFNEKTDNAIHKTVSKTLNNIDELIGLGLSVGDAPFLLGHYNDALAQLMSSRPDLTEPTLEMIDTAWDVAYRRTFRDDNAVTKALSSIRNSLPGIGETIAPYVQTPVNVVLTAIEYSPIGFIEAIGKTAFGKNSLTSLKQRGESTMKVQRQIADLFGRGAVGTAFMLLGALMKAAGRITDDDDDIDSQKEKNWNTATGRRGSSIKFGDKYVDPSSMQSLSTPLMAGAAAYDSDEGGTDWGGILGAAVKASMKMGNTMLEMPVLQGVADLFSGNYDDGEIIAGLLGLAGNAVTQVVPFGSAMRQAAKVADPYSRVQSEINEGPFKRIVKNTANNLKAMVPGVRETLPERTDVLGNPIKNDASRNVAERVYNSIFNPFNTSREVKNDVTDEIDRLFDELKDTDVLPPAAGNRISYGGEVYKFTSAEKQAYQRVEGETNTEIISSLVNSDAYNQLSSEDQAKVIESGYKYAANKAKADYLEKKGIEYTSDETWMDKIDAVVEAGVDIGSALVYRYEINQINGADDQAHYLMQQSISADQKKILDTQFVDKFGFHPIEDDHDYTSEDTLALSMTSDSGRGKYDRVFSGDWTAPSGNSYRALSGVEFGELYDACYFKSSPTKAESIESIRKMLMEEWGLDGYTAETLATDFRAVMGSKKY